MLSPRNFGRHIIAMFSCFSSADSLGRFSRRGMFLTAFPLAAACLLAAPQRLVAQQTLYWSDQNDSVIYSSQISGSSSSASITYVSGAGVPTSGNFSGPVGIAFDPSGNLYVADDGNGQLVQVGPGGDPANASYNVVNPGGQYSLSAAYDVATDSSGNIYLTDQSNEVLQFSPAGGGVYNQTQWLAGNSISAPSYSGQRLFSIAITSNGTVYIGTSALLSLHGRPVSDVILQTSLSNPSNVSLFSDGSDTPDGNMRGIAALTVDASGNVWEANSSDGVVNEYSSSGVYLNQIAGLMTPTGLAFDAHGNLWVADFDAGEVEEYSTAAATFGNLIQQIASNSPESVSFGFAAATPSGIEWNGLGTVGTGSWADPNNWTGGVVPGKIAANDAAATSTDTVLFDIYNSANQAPLVDAGRNVQTITFDNAGGSLTGSITLGTATGNALLLTSGGTIQTTGSVSFAQNVNAPLVLEGGGTYTFSSNASTGTATLNFGGAITAGTGSIVTLTLAGSNSGVNTISGPIADGATGGQVSLNVTVSSWALTAANTYSGGTTIASGATLQLANSTGSALTSSMNVINSGSLVVATANQVVGTVTGSGSTTVNAASSLTTYQVVQNSLTIGAGGKVTLLPSGSGSTMNPTGPNNINFSSAVTSLSIAGSMNAWTGTLDIGNNGLVIAYGAATDPFATITNMIESGYNGGVWGGTGITSTLAANSIHTSTPLNIGLLDFTPGAGNYSNTTFLVFEGQTVSTNAILIRLTYMDDLVLAGDMAQNSATSDALLFAANYGSGTIWGVGDLTHDGAIDSNDALLFAANYVVGFPSLDGTTGNALALGGAAAVPEPASLVLAAVAAFGFAALTRPRR